MRGRAGASLAAQEGQEGLRAGTLGLCTFVRIAMETARQPAASQQNLPKFPKGTSEDEAVKGALITRGEATKAPRSNVG